MKKMNWHVLFMGFILLNLGHALACSTFKLQKGHVLIYGHNLNEGDIGVPGMIFVNKRGIFKQGRTWDELITKDCSNPSQYFWISKYGSVTFNVFGRDFPDGGMNEVGLYIWEMNESADYPVNDSLPKLDQMNWMQYILDHCATVDEAIQCAYEIAVTGWGWHFFIGDAMGACAAVAFIDGKVRVHCNERMPVPGLFNTPYDREMELLRYYKGFGGFYDPVLDDPMVPRFVKTAVMIRDYDVSHDPVDYGFYMLETLTVFDVPEWSVIFDVRNMDVYFKTRLHPEVKQLSMENLDFSNKTPVQMLNMDARGRGNVLDRFHSFSIKEMRQFIEANVFPILPERFITMGGLSLEEFLDRFSSHTDGGLKPDNQYFIGTWKCLPNQEDGKLPLTITLHADKEAISGLIFTSSENMNGFEMNHLQLIGNQLRCTFKSEINALLDIKAILNGDQMKLNLSGTEQYHGQYILARTE